MSVFLFSVDVEDPRDGVPHGEKLPARVPQLVERYLDFLGRHQAKATFFVVGQVARRHKTLIRTLVDEGHEVGCHSDRHVPLDTLGPANFRDDTMRCLDSLHGAGAVRIEGYRAPCFSLTERTRWAYEVLADLGFRYSSSVLPAASPLHGWPGFGRRPRETAGGLWELPVTVLPSPLPPLPFGGGVYFRALPRWLVRRGLRTAAASARPVIGYFHPYDIDTDQEQFAHPGFRRGSPFNWLMYRNRHLVFERLELAAQLGFAFAPFAPYAEALREERQTTNG
jgi:polysaccharide deacetylase family protein (PEP-CTERM system associated)